MVVGLFNDVPFQQGAVEIEHGGILIAYSDGLIEPENVYGEEFGTARLIDVAIRNKDASSHVIAEAMMFHDLIGGENYTRLGNQYQKFIDLSSHLKMGQAILEKLAAAPSKET